MWRRKEDDLWVVLLRFCKSENARGPKGNKMVEWLFFFFPLAVLLLFAHIVQQRCPRNVSRLHF